MSEEDKVELSKRGLKQFKSVVRAELKPLLDDTIQLILKRTIQNRVAKALEGLSYRIEGVVKRQIDAMYWSVMEEALKKADFQDLFKAEIVKYLEKKWACGSIPFEEHFDKALVAAIKQIVKGAR